MTGKSEVKDKLAEIQPTRPETKNVVMIEYNTYKLAARAIVGALLLGCVTAFAGGVGVKADLLLNSAPTIVVGSVSAKNSNLGNFVTNVSLQSKDAARRTFEVYVVLESGSDIFYAGTFTTSAGGKGGVLFVNNTTVDEDFTVEVLDTTSGSVPYAKTDTMSLP